MFLRKMLSQESCPSRQGSDGLKGRCLGCNSLKFTTGRDSLVSCLNSLTTFYLVHRLLREKGLWTGFSDWNSAAYIF